MLTTIKGNFSTNLSQKEVCLKLKDLTTDSKISALDRNDVAFIGSIGNSSFSLTKYKFFNNDALNPTVHGEYTPDGQKTKITYVCSLRKSDRIASWIAGIVALIGILTFTIEGIFSSTEALYVPIGIAVGIVMFFAIFSLVYLLNTRKALKEFKKILHSE